MKNKEIYEKAPWDNKLLNDGVAELSDAMTSGNRAVLRFELERFVCDGGYQEGLIRILQSYLEHCDKPQQPAVWVSGPYGSGKSHLAKVLRFLWEDYQFPEDGAKARSLAGVSGEIKELLLELSTLGSSGSGLHAAAGTLGADVGGKGSVRLAVLAVVFRSARLPASYPQAKFTLWLRRNKLYTPMVAALHEEKRNFEQELRDMYVSPYVSKTLLKINPNFAKDAKDVGVLLRAQYKDVDDINTDEFVATIREVLTERSAIPCTAILLDEVQPYLGEDSSRTQDFQEVVEACGKRFGGKLLLLGIGQSALQAASALQPLQGLFTVNVQLSDNDVEQVVRKVVLAKKENCISSLREILEWNSGEAHRQLSHTRLKTAAEDEEALIQDYPLLPVRRRFWVEILRSLHHTGGTDRLRTQLRIIYEAARATAEDPLGTVVPTDFLYGQIASNLLQSGQLPREVHDRITALGDGTPGGDLRAGICSLVFLIGRLPRGKEADLGVRATTESLTDLLVKDLERDRDKLRQELPEALEKLVQEGILVKLEGDEYALQTREGSEWEKEFRKRRKAFMEDQARLSVTRTEVLQEETKEYVESISLMQGEYKTPRKLTWHIGHEAPRGDSTAIPVWIRDGWNTGEKEVEQTARAAGTESPLLYAFIPREHSDDLSVAIAGEEAARETLADKGSPVSSEDEEVRRVLATRVRDAEQERKRLVQKLMREVRIFQGGGEEIQEASTIKKLIQGARNAQERLFHEFHHVDDKRWRQVLDLTQAGSDAPLGPLGYRGPVEQHPVCAMVLEQVGPGRKGGQIREHFAAPPYGWPRDVIDSVIMSLCDAGRLHASLDGKPLRADVMVQGKIHAAEFHGESPTIGAPQLTELRELFQEAGISCQPGEEADAADKYLNEVTALAERIGGDPPFPKPPDTSHLKDMQGRPGEGRLQAIHARRKQLQKEIQEWREQAELQQKRTRQYRQLLELLIHAKGLPIARELSQQLGSIRQNRNLLQSENPMDIMEQKLATELRNILIAAEQGYAAAYEQEKGRLQEATSWRKLEEEEQYKILVAAGLDQEIDKGPIGTTEELRQSLEQVSLETWSRNKAAFPQLFREAFLQAVRQTEPEAQQAELQGAALRTPEDVEQWTRKSKQRLLELIKKGPVIAP